MNDFTDRKTLYSKRALMSFPEDVAGDDLRIAGVAAFLARLDGPLHLRLPKFDLLVEIDADVDAKSAYLIAVDDYEMADLVLMQAHLRASDRVVVIGGGYGVTAALAAKLTAQHAVVVVEANAALHARIARQVALNGCKATLIGKALVGDAAAHPGGTIGFEVSNDVWYSRVGSSAGAMQVPVIDMTELCAAPAPTAVMMDIEGAERDVLSHLIPACVRLMIVEIHTPDFGGAETAKLVSGLADQGFRMKDQLALVWVFERGM
jgi:FkbM family methyltransferase